jgi:hypothetical protein
LLIYWKFSISQKLKNKPSPYIYIQFLLHVNLTNFANFLGKFYQNINITKCFLKKPHIIFILNSFYIEIQLIQLISLEILTKT